ncbi:helix-turn-helix transcriptional regulator [Kibdelosporangium aridum]|uniref:Helix-turn-helix transcriptional regulator n=1 Tax=Kibdelosporangium aridum TaxID=2030 RepID=A0A428Z7J5_KIBAR|nr:LuxR family transcriptional regulator [Kibdelosporangium aridum]RSM83570.1 helix-turn-helix transcriptional regulator [Kibdelosporangium aridum]
MGDPRPQVGDRWPLVGRERQLSAITSTASGGVVLVGAAGVGKTRLAREVVARLKTDGRRTEWVAATRSMAAIPFGAVSHLLPPLNNDSRLSVLHAVAAHFTDSPVIAVDDAHLLDDASAAVVHHLAARQLAYLIVTVRAGEPCPDAVNALWKDGLTSRVGLAELPEDAVDQLLDHAFGSRLAPVSRRRLHRVSAGNPLLLREILLAGLDTGELRHRHGAWHWTGEVRATTRLADVVVGRLGSVADTVYAALEVVAGGEPVPVALLEQLVGGAAVATAERKGLVTTESAGRRLVARLSHPLYGEVIRSTMAASRARSVAGQLADAMTSTPMRRRDDALRVGTLQLQSGRTGDPRILLAAAKQAKDRFDHELAERLARSAHESGAGWAAEQLLAEVQLDRGRYDELTVPGSPGAGADDNDKVRWAITRADAMYWGQGKVAEAEQILDELDGDVADGSLVWILLFDSRCAEALALADKVLRSPSANPQALVWAASAGIPAAGFLGYQDRADEIYRFGTRVAAENELQVPWGPAQMGYGRCLSLLATGCLTEAWELADLEYQAAAAKEAIAPLGGWAGFRGAVAKARGELDVAAASFREVLALLPNYDTFRLAATCLAELAGARALAGDHRQAQRLLDRADSPTRLTSRLFQPWIELDRAWVFAASGEISKAAAHARETAEMARHNGLPTTEAFALYDVARLGEARSVYIRLSELATELTCDLGTTLADAACALVDNDFERLTHAADCFEHQGLWLHAAEAMVTTARLAHDAGAHTRATAATSRANNLMRLLPRARTPMLATTGLPAMLTSREREVALLAAQGQSSRRIAARLNLSVRTVDNYLGRAYAKLGVTSRTELGPLLSPRAPG